jgi:undecaprenyl diphosphate synthase
MPQSTLHHSDPLELHVAVIMDGSGRWAATRGLPRGAGHRQGVEAVRRIVEAAPGLGIGTLTLFAFSSDNWQRPAREVAVLMQLIRGYLQEETDRFVAGGIRVNMIGRRDRLPPSLLAAIEAVETATVGGRGLHLRLAVDYSAREAILRAACRLSDIGALSPEAFSRLLGEADHAGAVAPDVDLLIRAGGEQRLSDFLLWECAYAELVFTKRMWPDFEAADLEAAINEFRRRERRFGRLLEVAAGGYRTAGSRYMEAEVSSMES